MSILWTILIGFIAGVLAKLTPGSNSLRASSSRQFSAGIEPMRVRASSERQLEPAVTRPRSVP